MAISGSNVMQAELFSSGIKNILPFDGETILFPRFFEREDSDSFFSRLKNEIEWKHEPIKLFGKLIMQPRLTALYGDPNRPYGYSGIQMQPVKMTEFLLEIKEKVETQIGSEFSHVLLNYYRDGQDSMGWHRDNEAVLGPNPTIASVSFGESREFQMRHYSKKEIKFKVSLDHGSLLVMSGSSQHHWEHQIPKTNQPKGPRINLTFRKLF
jgi:alkylated DNA repair dioxygenase AlkB